MVVPDPLKYHEPVLAARFLGSTLACASLALSALLTAAPARATEEDPWWGRDKALHFGVSAGLGASGYAVSSLALDSRLERAAAGAAFSLTLGAGKELYDLSGGGDASWKDLTWDVAGTSVGVGLALLVDLIIAPKSTSASRTTAVVVRF
jgi:putative lipoprotein